MKAIQMSRFGGPEVFERVEVPTPEPGPGQVLVRVRTAGVNLADTLMRENRYAMTPPIPSVLGSEAAGVIEGLGAGVAGPGIGTRVAAPLFAAGNFFGGYADYVAINADLVTPLPDALPFEDATALMVQGLTALYLTRQAPPKGKIVLVNAAAGGVGSILVQLARLAGAKTIIAGASTAEKLAFARSLGAGAGVDYTRSDWAETLRAAAGGAGPDIVYESVGGPVTAASLAALAPLGQLVVYGALNIQSFQIGVPELLGLIFKNQSLTGFALAPLLTQEGLKAGLAELFDLAVRGELKVTVGGTYPLGRAADAHRSLESRKTTGKLVLVP
ncbi:MAG: zinc-binding dehydrogenase [Beijerinckiaceae bacterium]|nr:zinc-binding dehydrogenase [Beijerinckiaceae bacterium]